MGGGQGWWFPFAVCVCFNVTNLGFCLGGDCIVCGDVGEKLRRCGG